MKKLFMIIAALIIGVSATSAKETITRNVSDLPKSAQTMLKQHFPKTGVNHIKIDKKLIGNTDYDVILNDGTEIDFDHNGDWKEIDCGAKAVPSSLILKNISAYVAKNYKKAKIISIEKNSGSYEIELSNGIDLKFDRSGNFLRIDD